MGRGPRPIRTAAVPSSPLLVAMAGCLESDRADVPEDPGSTPDVGSTFYFTLPGMGGRG